MMKFSTRSVVAVAMIAALGMSAPAIASADTTTTTTVTTTTIPTTTTTVHGSNTPWKQWSKAENAYLPSTQGDQPHLQGVGRRGAQRVLGGHQGLQGLGEPPERSRRGSCSPDAVDRERDGGPRHGP